MAGWGLSQSPRCSRFPRHLLLIGLALWGSGCTGSAGPSPSASRGDRVRPVERPVRPTQTAPIPELHGVEFVDVAAAYGLDYAWPEQERPLRALDAFGCGCAAFDADNDGWADILLVAEPYPVLFRNVAGERFERVKGDPLQSVAGKWKSCAIGDYDGDGLLDVLVAGYHCLALYKNLGGWGFQLATQEAGLDAANHDHWGASAGFMDLDGDAWLDLVIVNCIAFGPESPQYCELTPGVVSGCIPRTYPAEHGEIWRNNGHGGFEAVPGSAGMDQTHGVGLVLAFTDIDVDGRVDFYIGNDGVPADFLRNLGGLQFQNIASSSGLALSESAMAVASMGADWADYNRDGRLDLAVSNFQNLSFVLFRNVGENCFLDASAQTDLARVTKNRLGFGTKWVDFENDGWPDLYFINGHVYDNSASVQGPGAQFRQRLLLLRNERGKKFVDLVPALGPGVQRTMVGRGSATVDFNNDGRIDLLGVDYEGPVLLLENRARGGNHWLTLDLRGAPPNAFAYGARVVGKRGEQTWVSEVSPVSSYLSSSDVRVHWGLGAEIGLDAVEVRWPSGKLQVIRDVTADQILRIAEK